MTEQEVRGIIRDIPDFPKEGIHFKDLTTALKRHECIEWFANKLIKMYKGKGITKVVGIESRGFIMAPLLAYHIGAGFVPVRKKGKLPAEVVEVSYQKEYGVDILQMHKDALTENDVVLIHDDLLATGGTTQAVIDIVKSFGVKKIYVNALIELDFLHGRNNIEQGVEVDTIVHY